MSKRSPTNLENCELADSCVGTLQERAKWQTPGRAASELASAQAAGHPNEGPISRQLQCPAIWDDQPQPIRPPFQIISGLPSPKSKLSDEVLPDGFPFNPQCPLKTEDPPAPNCPPSTSLFLPQVQADSHWTTKAISLAEPSLARQNDRASNPLPAQMNPPSALAQTPKSGHEIRCSPSGTLHRKRDLEYEHCPPPTRKRKEDPQEGIRAYQGTEFGGSLQQMNASIEGSLPKASRSEQLSDMQAGRLSPLISDSANPANVVATDFRCPQELHLVHSGRETCLAVDRGQSSGTAPLNPALTVTTKASP